MLHASAIGSPAGPGETGDVDSSPVQAPLDRRQSASNQAWLGRIIDERYRVIEAIGSGGMGVVYKVEHVRMGKIAAMKVLHRDLARDPDVEQRFEREAAAVSRLHHPNTVQVFDFGAEQGALYLVMEYVRGQDLGHIVDRDGPMPFARAAPLLIQILGALSEAHGLGIVHRDLKPENVLITRTTGGRDFAKVLDFGLAKVIEPGRPTVSDHAQIVGTPYFMAPEQIRGEDVDARVDVYAMGAVMYKLLTGTYPYDARTSVGVLTKHLTAELELPSRRAPRLGLEPGVDEIVEIALAKDPKQRWATAAAMAEAIERTYTDLVGEQIRGATQPVPFLRRSVEVDDDDDEPVSEVRLRRSDLDIYERSLRRQRIAATLLGGVFMMAIALAAVWWLVLRRPAVHRREVEPNDALADATVVATGAPIVGYLGKRRSTTEGDIDIFRVELSGAEPIATVRVAALPNLDVTLTLRGGGGSLIALVDEEALGGGEVVHRHRADRALLIEVAQSSTGGYPIENVSDPYTLEVIDETARDGWEIEPNGETSDATPIDAAPVRGYLDRRDDVDTLRWDGAEGEATVAVEMASVDTLEWSGPDLRWAPPGRRTLKLRRGDLLRLRRADADAAKGPLRGREVPWTVTITSPAGPAPAQSAR